MVLGTARCDDSSRAALENAGGFRRLPFNVLEGLPEIELLGNREAVIEHCQGVLESMDQKWKSIPLSNSGDYPCLPSKTMHSPIAAYRRRRGSEGGTGNPGGWACMGSAQHPRYDSDPAGAGAGAPSRKDQ